MVGVESGRQDLRIDIAFEIFVKGKELKKIEPELSAKMANMGIVSAFLVVALHGYAMASMPAPGSVSWWFYKLFKENFTDIAVPYFFLAAAFFLAGHFGEQGWFWREVCKRIRSLLVPMFL